MHINEFIFCETFHFLLLGSHVNLLYHLVKSIAISSKLYVPISYASHHWYLYILITFSTFLFV